MSEQQPSRRHHTARIVLGIGSGAVAATGGAVWLYRTLEARRQRLNAGELSGQIAVDDVMVDRKKYKRLYHTRLQEMENVQAVPEVRDLFFRSAAYIVGLTQHNQHGAITHHDLLERFPRLREDAVVAHSVYKLIRDFTRTEGTPNLFRYQPIDQDSRTNPAMGYHAELLTFTGGAEERYAPSFYAAIGEVFGPYYLPDSHN